MKTSTTWKKGAPSPNPGGRPKADRELAARIRLQTKNGEELADLLLVVARGTHPVLASEESMRWAIDMLFKRGWGMPAPAGTYDSETKDEAPQVIDTSRLSRDELATFASLMAKIAAEPDEAPSEGGRVLPFPGPAPSGG